MGWWGTDTVDKPLGKRYVPITVKFKKQVQNSVYRAMSCLREKEVKVEYMYIGWDAQKDHRKGNPDKRVVFVFVRGS